MTHGSEGDPLSSSMERSADTVFQRSFSAPLQFDDITERGALKLTSILRVTAPRHFDLWLSEVGGRDFFERTGLFIPIVAFDLFVSDAPVRLGADVEISITIRLGRQLDDAGELRRLVSESVGEIYAVHADTGELVLVARNIKHNAMSRNDPDPAKRRVTEFPATMNLGKVPQRVISLPGVAELAEPPPGYSPLGSLADARSRVWSYLQTDMNRHVHAMEYVRMLDLFATEHLYRLAKPPRDHLIERTRVSFRKPCFPGEEYFCRGTYYSGGEAGPDVLCAQMHKGESAVGEPAVAAQMFIRQRDPDGD